MAKVTLEEKAELAFAQLLAKEALDKLKAGGVIKSHKIMAAGFTTTSGQYTPEINIYDYPIKAGNIFSLAFKKVFTKLNKTEEIFKQQNHSYGSYISSSPSATTSPPVGSWYTSATSLASIADGNSASTGAISLSATEMAQLQSYPTQAQQKSYLEGKQAINQIKINASFFNTLKRGFSDYV